MTPRTPAAALRAIADDAKSGDTIVRTKPATKPIALTLRPYEARRLARAGRVLVVRPVWKMPWQSDRDPKMWLVSDGRRRGWSSNKMVREVFDRDTKAMISREEYYVSKDELLMKTCPFGPSGAMLWGREGWAKSPRGQIYRVEAEQSDGFGSFVIDLATGDTVPLVWMSATSMSRERSRFPRLRHESSEVKLGSHATAEDIAATGGEITDIPDRQCWFSLIVDADQEESAAARLLQGVAARIEGEGDDDRA
jgi:hypothetical protein